MIEGYSTHCPGHDADGRLSLSRCTSKRTASWVYTRWRVHHRRSRCRLRMWQAPVEIMHPLCLHVFYVLYGDLQESLWCI